MTFDQGTGGAATCGRHVRFELQLTACALAFTIGTSTWLVWSLTEVGLAEADRGWLRGLGAAVFTASVGAVIYGSLVYQVARLGWLNRTRAHRRASRHEMDAGVFGGDAQPLVILVPAYREDAGVVRQTLLSAALQDYPNRRVVLLLDDPPAAADAETEAVRELPLAIEAMLAPMARRMRLARAAFEDRRVSTAADAAEELLVLAELYDSAARWFEDRARGEALDSHIDRHFVAITFQARAVEMHATSARLRRNVGGAYHADKLAAAYRRLAGLFDVTLEVFERKRYRNLSHEPNKAMNLNAYVGLLGGEYDIRQSAEGAVIARSSGHPELVVPDATWVLTLDADSMLVHDYASRLVQRMGQPGMERVAVIQTPYSAVPGAPGLFERIAGATTDIMHVVQPGNDGLRRDLLGRRERAAPQDGARGHRHFHHRARPRGAQVHPGPDRHRGHRVQRGPRGAWMVAPQLPRAARVQRDPA